MSSSSRWWGRSGGRSTALVGLSAAVLAWSSCVPVGPPGLGLCGNGTIDPGEDCDGVPPSGQDCTTVGQGFVGGLLGCASNCTFDVSGCIAGGVCGDGAVDSGEECDGADLGAGSCRTLGFTPGGALACTADCSYDTSECTLCGDGVAEGPEECDGDDFGGHHCSDIGQGYIGGILACDLATCRFLTVACIPPPDCGNGVIEAGEQCDGANLGGLTCPALGFGAGALGCYGGCVLDTSECYTCGNGQVEGPEACDSTNLFGESCMSLGHDGGQLACAATCLLYDESPCTDCGDGVVEGIEECDDGNEVSCDGCSAECRPEACGNGVIECAEQCDDGNQVGCDGCSRLCTIEGPPACGNGVLDCGEECDDGNTSNLDGCSSECLLQCGAALGVADVLFVIDNSGNMCQEQLLLRNAFPQFLAGFAAAWPSLDFHIGVVTTDLLEWEESGRLQNEYHTIVPGPLCPEPPPALDCTTGLPSPLPKILTAATPRIDDVFACIASVGINGFGAECSLGAARLALSDGLLDDPNANQGFLRSDSLLAVIIVGDEDDCSVCKADLCFPLPGITRNLDCSINRFTELTPTDDFAAYFEAVHPSERLFVGGLIGLDSSGSSQGPIIAAPDGGDYLVPICEDPDGGEAVPAPRIEDFVRDRGATHFMLLNLCSDDYGPGLYEMGYRIARLASPC